MEIKQLLEELDEVINIAMTIDVEGELFISEDNGVFSWEYNGESQEGFKSKNEAIKAFKKCMKQQGFRNIKTNIEYI